MYPFTSGRTDYSFTGMNFIVNKLLHDLLDDLTPISSFIDELEFLGYDERFELLGNKLMAKVSGGIFYPNELSVDHLYHMDGIGYVYGLRHRDTQVKGIFVLYSVNSTILNQNKL